MINKIFLISTLILGGAGIAQAQDTATTASTTTTVTTASVPTCSKTVTDKCVNRTAVKKVVHVHHRTVVKKTTTKAG